MSSTFRAQYIWAEHSGIKACSNQGLGLCIPLPWIMTMDKPNRVYWRSTRGKFVDPYMQCKFLFTTKVVVYFRAFVCDCRNPCTVCSLTTQWTVHSAQGTVYSAHCSVHIAVCTLQCAQRTRHSAHCSAIAACRNPCARCSKHPAFMLDFSNREILVSKILLFQYWTPYWTIFLWQNKQFPKCHQPLSIQTVAD